MTKKSYQRQQRDAANQPPQKIDFALHKAQQLESLVANLELLKNNVYGDTQVNIVLYALNKGMNEEEAIQYSLTLIDKMNEVNLKRIQEKRKQIEDKMKAATPPQVPQENLPEAPPADETAAPQ